MNPLSPFTYYRRHKGQALLLVGLIAALTLGVYSMVSLWDMAFESAGDPVRYLTRMTRIVGSDTPSLVRTSQISAGGTLDPSVVAQIRAHPGIAAMLPENGLYIMVPRGIPAPFPVLGVTEAGLTVVMRACDLRLKEGRLIKPRTAEFILSEELAGSLGLEIGDRISYDINADYYPTMATELTLVGTLESTLADIGPDVQVGFASYEFLESHELYQPRSSNWLVIPHLGNRLDVNDFIQGLFAEGSGTASAYLETFEGEMTFWKRGQETMDALFGFVDIFVAGAAALVVGMIHRIAIARRLPDLGLLHAAGHQKRTLVRCLVLEISIIACAGGALGLLCGHAFLMLLENTYFHAQGWGTNLSGSAAALYTLLIPLVVIGWIAVSTQRTMSRLDPVAIIERGKLSAEETEKTKKERSRASRSSHNPLSSRTFHLRHRRRTVLMLSAIGLMVLSVALPGFLLTVMLDASLPSFVSYASHCGIVSPGYTYRTIAPDIIAQIRAHPAVAHVIPAKPQSMMVRLPLVGELGSIPVYAVREQDLPILLDAYGLHVSEGTTVQPRSDQIVLTSGLARNRGLGVSDTIGHPVHPQDGMPTELTVAGLLDSTSPALVEREGFDVPLMPRWAGFASYEYVDSHERYAGTPTHLLVVPVRGRESEMEAWLENDIASTRARIATLGTSYGYWQEIVLMNQAVSAISMTTLAAVAGIGLAILNTINVTQRRDEFGALHALGHARAGLIARTLRESASITTAAWLLGVVACIAGMVYVQATVLTPLGMSLDLTNLTPWLFTLPIPLAVVAASTWTIAWALSRLDPVAVIERR